MQEETQPLSNPPADQGRAGIGLFAARLHWPEFAALGTGAHRDDPAAERPGD